MGVQKVGGFQRLSCSTPADMVCEETNAKSSSSGLGQMRSEMNRTGNE